MGSHDGLRIQITSRGRFAGNVQRDLAGFITCLLLLSSAILVLMPLVLVKMVLYLDFLFYISDRAFMNGEVCRYFGNNV